MARSRGGWLKQKWQEDHHFPDTRVILLERQETEQCRGGEMVQLIEKEADEMLRKWTQDDTNMTSDYTGCLEQSSAMDSHCTCCLHKATPQPEHTDQNNMAEK
ncbi:hypothetical protein JOB18_028584 [Solea senegalensis]|uniref:Uncharacterized protein n=1 Tax=Solea senegalensis TaxID=28829 RepID=A0AAV6RJH9_SOLSE|nr:hypothetical protein JOB18_028584 [Solea senegalensis]